MSNCTCNILFNTPCKACTEFESIEDYEVEIIEDEEDDE